MSPRQNGAASATRHGRPAIGCVSTRSDCHRPTIGTCQAATDCPIVGSQPASDTIDALPTFPTQELGTLPIDATTTASKPSTSTTSRTSTSSDDRPDTTTDTGSEAPPRPAAPHSSVPAETAPSYR